VPDQGYRRLYYRLHCHYRLHCQQHTLVECERVHRVTPLSRCWCIVGKQREFVVGQPGVGTARMRDELASAMERARSAEAARDELVNS
jgi:hypothetical protein